MSLRNFIDAPPPGRILKRPIPLDLLPRKCDVFFNQRERPLLQIRLDGPKFGISAATVAFDRPGKGYDRDNPLANIDLAGSDAVFSANGTAAGKMPDGAALAGRWSTAGSRKLRFYQHGPRERN